ncbi:TonB family protein [Bradyrhizobium sp.]|uniref:energy transducer TonB family protein n=1 Tax=Bradyrhizobium sp. TaxID=376 RepID=UPI002C88ACBE|nr:TonB family protein [Bradyrhizobium sp.]HWX59865.1 TonB family protein [Bradyrhizobium sp.]
MTVLTVDADRPDQSGEFALWVAAGVIVLALHVGLAVTYLWLRPEPETRAEAPAFDVAFMPATSAPAAPPSIDQPDPVPAKMDQPEDPPKEQLSPPPVQDEPPPPAPQVEAMVPPEVPPPPAPLVPVEPAPPVPEQLAIVPPEKPVEVAPPPAKQFVAPEPSPRKVTHDEKVEKHQAPPKSVASPGTKPMRVASAPNSGAESEGARVGRESWLSQFAAQIQRFATYATNGNRETGTAQVSVTVDRNGRLLAHHIAKTGGSATLDHSALSIIERAAPFPHFPASMTEAQITRLVPIHLRPQ